jgi:hypothetical protein
MPYALYSTHIILMGLTDFAMHRPVFRRLDAAFEARKLEIPLSGPPLIAPRWLDIAYSRHVLGWQNGLSMIELATEVGWQDRRFEVPMEGILTASAACISPLVLLVSGPVGGSSCRLTSNYKKMALQSSPSIVRRNSTP